ncbi:hypothetical protein CNMCM6936_006911 [Aspergillus lentulus]|uniref:Reverse transcriptase/retrotransposon-derived protein RNase H-like domain-containing protein n=1 Tax=Aspergillus lentulus TaxID=293939 RepID=A0AAN5YLX7_ASPLE|nr:hypothetical protein CNMCM6069_008951 [Aspergillus lentulus]KAF4169752.1 hypothetical protein CNMCM6936_006911 [Aspergillus lentulus]KAF4182984.1 hypothetical protein CNMCM7927_009361 [Aspergillus lentulus]KAF4203243.1 hypothetical protein CNMCM8927_009005 [Aspergillus lentulus]
MESGSSSLIEAAPRDTTVWLARIAYFPGRLLSVTAVLDYSRERAGERGLRTEAFVRHRDSYVLPFSPKNAPSEFQLYIERVLGHTLGDEVTAHIDNILIHSLDSAKSAVVMQQVAMLLNSTQIKINTEKSQYLISFINSYHVQAILRFANHFQDHALGLAYAAQSLQPWQWTSTSRTDPCEFTTNASLFAIGTILSQNSHVTTIISRSLTKEERNYDAAERELLGVVYALYCFTLVDAQQSQLQQAAFGSKPPLSPAMPHYSAALDICNLAWSARLIYVARAQLTLSNYM